MKRAEFDNLKVGDLCVVKGKYDNGRIVTVRYIEDEMIVIKAVDGECFHDPVGIKNKKLKMTGWHWLDVMPKKVES